MGERFRTQEAKLDLGGPDDEGEPALGLEGLAAVDREAEQGAVLAPDLELGLAVEDHGAVRERVRADRREDEHGGGGIDERAARGEVVGRGAGRGGEDQAVGAVLVDAGAVGEQWLVRGPVRMPLAGVGTTELQAGDRILIRTPGGGGWGSLADGVIEDDQADNS